jgi:hypothetical protein
VTFLTADDVKSQGLLPDYDRAFAPGSLAVFQQAIVYEQTSHPQEAEIVTGTAIAAAAMGFAVDYVKGELEKESGRYTAQFSQHAALQRFLERIPGDKPRWRQRIFAVRIGRITKEHPADSPAFELILGIGPADYTDLPHENALFLTRPLRVQTLASKAKVLEIKPWSYLIPPFVWPYLLTAHEELKTSVDIKVDQVGVSRKGEGQAVTAPAWQLQLPNYSMKDRPVWHANDGKLKAEPLAALTADPNAIYSVTATVTERDESNAQQQIKTASEFVGKQREKLVNAAKGAGEK